MIKKRSCSLCRRKQEKNRLYRIVAVDSIAILDERQKINSRGMYICKEKSCIENCLKVIDKKKINLKISTSCDSLKSILELLLTRMEE